MKKGITYTLIFVSSLITSLLVFQLLFLSPTLLRNNIYTYLIIVIGIFAISLLTYHSFSSLSIKKSNILISTLIISILSLIPTFFINSGLRWLSPILTSRSVEVEGLIGQVPQIFALNNLINIWIFSILIIIFYNIIPLISIFKTNSSAQSQT